MNLTCIKCGRSMDDGNFYTYHDGSKMDICKKCLTLHIDNFDESTFLWILEKLDVPYIPSEWNVLRNRAYEKDPDKMNGMSVIGKYLSKMKLKQHKDERWADTERLKKQDQEKQEKIEQGRKIVEEDIQRRFDNGEISESEYKTMMSTATQYKKEQEKPIVPVSLNEAVGENNYYNENNFVSEDLLPDVTSELTQDDKVYLAMKWGRLYTTQQAFFMETKYNEMKSSFDVNDSDSEGALVLICKTFLKMNEALDSGDISTYQALSRVYESLRKSAKFTAAQNKEKKDENTCIGKLVAMCEREGFIPRYVTDVPQDKVDAILKDSNNYVYNLVTQDLGFGHQIENALRRIQLQKQKNEEENDEEDEIKNSDYEEYRDELEKQRDEDEEILKGDNQDDFLE